MPQVQRPELYNAIIEVARAQFAHTENLEPYLTTYNTGSPLYRYVSYRNAEPQIEAAGRTIWTPLANDTDNRWTGRGPGEPAEGHQGLYLSGEYLDKAQPFPELEHYINQGAPLTEPVFYYRYTPGQAPELILGTVGELRSMFLFTAQEGLHGINLSLNAEGEHPLLEEIFDTAKERYPEAFRADDTLATLYHSSDDASFCRAIGNAVLETTRVDFFQTVSVRDGVSSNVILRGQQGTPAAMLTPQGRASFLLGPQHSVEGVFTVLDLQYNVLFEQDGLEVLPPRQELEANLKAIAEQMTGKLIDAYEHALEVQAPTGRMEEIGTQLQIIHAHLDNDDLANALSTIDDVQASITAFRGDNGLSAIEVSSFKTVDYVMQSLKSITQTIDVAQHAPVEGSGEPREDIADIPFADPREEQMEPGVKTPVEH